MSEGLSLIDGVREACLAGVPDVLETMFFESLVDAPAVGELPDSGPLDTSRVDFEGSAKGHFIVAVPPALTLSLAETFLGLDDQSAPDTNSGLVLGELANMVCGNTLSRYQQDGNFRLDMPATRLGLDVAELSDLGLTWLRFSLDSGVLFVGLSMEATQ